MNTHIRIRCPGCDARIKAPIEMLGQTHPCPRCRRRLLLRTKAPSDAQPMLSGDDLPAAAPLRKAG